MKARPDLTPNQNKLYNYTMSMFRSGGERMTAFQAGQLDALTSSTTGVLFAASKGVPIVVPVSMARESTKTFSTSYLRARGLRRHADQSQGQDDRHQRLPHQHRALCSHRGRQGRPRSGSRRQMADRAAAADGRSAAPEEDRSRRLSDHLRVSRHEGRRGEEGVRFRRHQRHRGGVRRRLQPGLRQEASRGRCSGLGFGLRRADPLLRGEAGRGAQEPHRLRASFRPTRRSTSA